MRFQCLIIILVLTNYLVQSYYTPTQSDFTNVEEMLKNILNKYITPLQKHVAQLINQPTNRVFPTPPPGPPRPKCLCGRTKASSRIVKNAEKNEFPWQVGLTRRVTGNIFCGGSIVSTRSIVTAAHCLQNVLGSLYVVVADGQKYYKVCRQVRHPSYRQDNDDDYNYAILTLCKPLTWGPSVSPVCLPSILNGEGYYEDRNAIVSGWGSTYPKPSERDTEVRGTLKKATVHTITNRQCCSRIGTQCPSWITDRTICADGDTMKDPSVGDDGGPLVVQNPNFGYYDLVGIVSKQKRFMKFDGKYARVTVVVPWLKSRMEGSWCYKK